MATRKPVSHALLRVRPQATAAPVQAPRGAAAAGPIKPAAAAAAAQAVGADAAAAVAGVAGRKRKADAGTGAADPSIAVVVVTPPPAVSRHDTENKQPQLSPQALHPAAAATAPVALKAAAAAASVPPPPAATAGASTGAARAAAAAATAAAAAAAAAVVVVGMPDAASSDGLAVAAAAARAIPLPAATAAPAAAASSSGGTVSGVLSPARKPRKRAADHDAATQANHHHPHRQRQHHTTRVKKLTTPTTAAASSATAAANNGNGSNTNGIAGADAYDADVRAFDVNGAGLDALDVLLVDDQHNGTGAGAPAAAAAAFASVAASAPSSSSPDRRMHELLRAVQHNVARAQAQLQQAAGGSGAAASASSSAGGGADDKQRWSSFLADQTRLQHVLGGMMATGTGALAAGASSSSSLALRPQATGFGAAAGLAPITPPVAVAVAVAASSSSSASAAAAAMHDAAPASGAPVTPATTAADTWMIPRPALTRSGSFALCAQSPTLNTAQTVSALNVTVFTYLGPDEVVLCTRVCRDWLRALTTQRHMLDSALGRLARAQVYRQLRAREREPVPSAAAAKLAVAAADAKSAAGAGAGALANPYPSLPSHRVRAYLHTQPQLNMTMRCILVDWLVDVRDEFSMSDATLHLAVRLLDRLLYAVAVPRKELQLAGAACLLLAAKLEERQPPTVDDLQFLCDGVYTHAQIRQMETAILGKLAFACHSPTVSHALDFYCAEFGLSDRASAWASFVAELCVIEYSLHVEPYHPTQVATAIAVWSAYTHGMPCSTLHGMLCLSGYTLQEVHDAAVLVLKRYDAHMIAQHQADTRTHRLPYLHTTHERHWRDVAKRDDEQAAAALNQPVRPGMGAARFASTQHSVLPGFLAWLFSSGLAPSPLLPPEEARAQAALLPANVAYAAVLTARRVAAVAAAAGVGGGGAAVPPAAAALAAAAAMAAAAPAVTDANVAAVNVAPAAAAAAAAGAGAGAGAAPAPAAAAASAAAGAGAARAAAK